MSFWPDVVHRSNPSDEMQARDAQQIFIIFLQTAW